MILLCDRATPQARVPYAYILRDACLYPSTTTFFSKFNSPRFTASERILFHAGC